jgi:hypothetical protein
MLFSFAGLKAKGQILGPKCGKDLKGLNLEIAGDIIAPGGGVGGALDFGSLGVGASVGPEAGVGFFIGVDFCYASVLRCWNTPCECAR